MKPVGASSNSTQMHGVAGEAENARHVIHRDRRNVARRREHHFHRFQRRCQKRPSATEIPNRPIGDNATATVVAVALAPFALLTAPTPVTVASMPFAVLKAPVTVALAPFAVLWA